jgi:hypothetical protein
MNIPEMYQSFVYDVMAYMEKYRPYSDNGKGKKIWQYNKDRKLYEKAEKILGGIIVYPNDIF